VARRTASAATATPWGWAVAGACLGLLVAVVLFAPARWLALAVAQGSSQQVLLQSARGTVWTGSAQLVLTGGTESRDAAALPERVTWRIRPAGLAAGIALQALCCMDRPWHVTLAPRWTGVLVTLADGRSRWPASLLAGLGTPWNTMQPEGLLTLTSQGLSMQWISNRLVLAGRLQLEATDVSSRLSTLKPMGSYRVTLVGGAQDAPATLQLETIAGSLNLSGSGQWVGSRLRFEGQASAAPDRVDALSNLLNIIGRRDGARSIIKVG
jgi:general secretion pathway protein N